MENKQKCRSINITSQINLITSNTATSNCQMHFVSFACWHFAKKEPCSVPSDIKLFSDHSGIIIELSNRQHCGTVPQVLGNRITHF